MVRLDKFLDAVCVFKTRSAASKAIRSDRVLVDDRPARASHVVRAGDCITLVEPTVRRRVTVLEVPAGNVSKKDRDRYCRIDVLPPGESAP